MWTQKKKIYDEAVRGMQQTKPEHHEQRRIIHGKGREKYRNMERYMKFTEQKVQKQ